MNRQEMNRKGKRLVRTLGPLAPRHFRNLANKNDRSYTVSERTKQNLRRIENLRLKAATYNALDETIAMLQQQNNELHLMAQEANQSAHYWYQSYQGLLDALRQSGIISNSNNHGQIIKQIQMAARPASRQVILPPIRNTRSTTAFSYRRNGLHR